MPISEDEHNVLHHLTYPQKRHEFLCYILKHKSEIEAIVACHLGLTRTEKCRLSPTEDWTHGSFNLCVPVDIDNWIKRPGKRVIIRFPLLEYIKWVNRIIPGTPTKNSGVKLLHMSGFKQTVLPSQHLVYGGLSSPMAGV
jgi:hypothetical protein